MNEVHWIKGKTDNCYLVTNGTKAVLVDTASGECYDTVFAECSQYDLVGKVVLGMSLKVLRNTVVEKPENTFFIKEPS